MVFGLKQMGVPFGVALAGLMLPGTAEFFGWRSAMLSWRGAMLSWQSAMLSWRSAMLSLRVCVQFLSCRRSRARLLRGVVGLFAALPAPIRQSACCLTARSLMRL
jgi:hypothetical protein